MPRRIIGVTGGIGAGKSAAVAVLASLGASVIHADTVGHECYSPGTPGWRRVVDAFGAEIVAPDGSIDRGKLGHLVFSSPRRLKQLNRLLHPLIAEEMQRRVRERLDADCRGPIVIEAALLIEAGWTSFVDEVWLVVADRATIIERLSASRGLSADAIAARINAQSNDAERRAVADVIIDNNGSRDALREELTALWRERFAN